jgi:hypothetical protein
MRSSNSAVSAGKKVLKADCVSKISFGTGRN